MASPNCILNSIGPELTSDQCVVQNKAIQFPWAHIHPLVTEGRSDCYSDNPFHIGWFISDCASRVIHNIPCAALRHCTLYARMATRYYFHEFDWTRIPIPRNSDSTPSEFAYGLRHCYKSRTIIVDIISRRDMETTEPSEVPVESMAAASDLNTAFSLPPPLHQDISSVIMRNTFLYPTFADEMQIQPRSEDSTLLGDSIPLPASVRLKPPEPVSPLAFPSRRRKRLVHFLVFINLRGSDDQASNRSTEIIQRARMVN